MQDAHNGDDHHPAGLIRLAAVAAALIAATAAHAAEPRFVALPSPLTPLTASPPIGGGASAGGEGHPHRVIATLSVRVSIDAAGAPFALRATQRLDVRRIGDYAFTIGAPLDEPARPRAGSTRRPGLRTGAYLWQGFNPGRRILAASVELELRAAAALPLRIEVERRPGHACEHDGRRRAAAFAADGNQRSCARTSRRFALPSAAVEPATGGGTTSPRRRSRCELTISAPLAIDGTIGTRRVRLTLGGAGRPETRRVPGRADST